MSKQKSPSSTGLNRPIGELFSRKPREEHVEHPAFAPTLPRVNLIPASVLDSLRVAKTVRIGLVTAIVLILAGAGVWLLQGSQIAAAQQRYDASVAQSEVLREQVKALSPISAMVTNLEAQQGLVATALASQPEASVIIEHLAAAGVATGSPTMTFDTISVTYSPIPAPGGQLNPCPDPDPFGTEIAVGCITFTASAGSRDQVATLLTKLEADPMFVGPYVSSSTVAAQTGQGSRVTFSGSAGLSPQALQTPLTQEQIDALLAPPAASASASPSPTGGE